MLEDEPWAGWVRNTVPSSGDSIRLGMALADLTDSERSVLDVLPNLQVAR